MSTSQHHGMALDKIEMVHPYFRGTGMDGSQLEIFLPNTSDVTVFDSVYIKSSKGEYELIVDQVETVEDDDFLETFKRACGRITRHTGSLPFESKFEFDLDTLEVGVMSSNAKWWSSGTYASAGPAPITYDWDDIKERFEDKKQPKSVVKGYNYQKFGSNISNAKTNSLRKKISRIFQRRGR